MTGQPARVRRLLSLLCIALVGCAPTQPFFLHEDGDLSHYLDTYTEIAYPDVDQPPEPEAAYAQAPITLDNPDFQAFWDMTLEEAISTGLQNSKVIPTLGQVRLQYQVGQSGVSPAESLTISPEFSATVYDPALQETSNTGTAAALAQFDAQFSTRMFWEKTDRPQNVEPTQIGQQIFARLLDTDTGNLEVQIQKRAANGSIFAFRNLTTYESTNRPLRALPSDWLTAFEAEARQPLLRNAGTQVNRIPLVVARIRTDVSIAQFERAVRDYVLQVERSYWDLYFLYRNLDAAVIGRDSALQTWQRIYALFQESAEGGEAGSEAQAREQYYAFEARAKDAQNRLLQAEANLRYLLGITSSDGRLIRPADEPTMAPVTFDYELIKQEALARNTEIRQQRWVIKQSELQLIAARNQLLPQLDAVALYRWLGMGDDLISSDRNGLDFPAVGSTAFDNLTQGDFQEWRLGFELGWTLGFREELSRVRFQELQLARDRERLKTLEMEVVNQLNVSLQNIAAQRATFRTRLEQFTAAKDQVESHQAQWRAGAQVLDLLLQAQQRQADAMAQFYEALVGYNSAIAQLHRVKGSLLEYNNIVLAEGPWPDKAYYDALLEARARDASLFWQWGWTRPNVASRGPVLQHQAQLPVGEEFGEFVDQVTDSAEELPAPTPAERMPGQADEPLPLPRETSPEDITFRPGMPTLTATPRAARRQDVLPKLTGPRADDVPAAAVPQSDAPSLGAPQPAGSGSSFEWGNLELDGPIGSGRR